MSEWTCKCALNGVQTEAKIPFTERHAELCKAIRSKFHQQLRSTDFILTDFNRDIKTDADVALLDHRDTIWVLSADETGQSKERISFPPHPKTLTRAGDYEYFAAQGRTPFPYALAELIDNSLRATMRGRSSQRRITISFVLSSPSNPQSGLISIWDNGSGMTSRALNEWAVMNLSMEDRGDKPTEEPVQRGNKSGIGATRFLNGNLSYFGVGSKNAAFYLGKCIKVATRCSGSNYVHELGIAASELEQRYREGKAVYEEDLVHRKPGQGTAHQFEESFHVAKDWIQEESCKDQADGLDSFTRVVIGDLKPEILRHIGKAAGREELCKGLAHLYHYYLHGEQGNMPGSSNDRSQALPQIQLECIVGNVNVWQCKLAEVDNDLESCYLQAQKSEFHFSLEVEGKGQIEGVLWYFPFQNETESLPVEDFQLVHNPITSYKMTQQPAQMISQVPTTQAGQQTQAAIGPTSTDAEDIPLWQRSKGALFEAFWQGRLIPGAKIESLPFIEAVRMKRGAAAKDVIPDEAFLRLRGALFFGPGFLVTRNKLTFRDNLQELLRDAISKERAQEKLFKEWLTNCHHNLDKVIQFERLATKEIQAEAKKLLGKVVTAFECISEGSRMVQRGDVVRLAVKPTLLGRVEFFSVNQEVQEGGAYAHGLVTVQPLPEAVLGKQVCKTLPLRRIEAIVEESEAAEHCTKELLKLPKGIELTLEPEQREYVAGAEMSETTACILNGTNQKVTKVQIGGEKHSFNLCQKLWYCPTGVRETEQQAVPSEEAVQQKKPKKGRKKNKQPATAEVAFSPAPDAEVVSEHMSTNPVKDSFQFPAITGCMDRAGTYLLQYTIAPPMSSLSSITCSLQLLVHPGPAVELVVKGEGRQAMATADLMLGEWLPDLYLSFQDSFGNATVADIDMEGVPEIALYTADVPDEAEDLVKIPDLESFFVQETAADGSAVVLSSMQIVGHKAYVPGSGPLSIFSKEANVVASQNDQTAEDSSSLSRLVHVSFCWDGFSPVIAPLKLLPGLPKALQLLPGHPFTAEEDFAGQRLPTIHIPSGSNLEDFTVQALDQWGNPTQPCAEMPFDLSICSVGLAPDEATVHFEPLATVTGLKASKATEGATPFSRMTCKLVFPGCTEEAAVELLGGAALPLLELGICLEPSTEPAGLRLLWKDCEIPTKISEDGEAYAVIEGIPAGSLLSDLAFICTDETGKPAEAGTSGKMQVSWTRGAKRIQLGEGPTQLPDLQAQEHVSDKPLPSWLRLSTAGRNLIELAIHVLVVAAEPYAWTAAAVDGGRDTQGLDAEGHVQCGQFFRLQVSAVDAYNNRCLGKISHLVPTPSVQPESTDGGQLVFEEAEWEQGWSEREDGSDIFTVKLRMGGNPGSVHLHVRDGAGVDGESKLAADCLDVFLDAGPPTCLMFDAPSILDCGMRSTLSELRIKVTDDYGNPAPANYEVALLPSAVCTVSSGQSAAVTTQSGNKARVKKGVGVFKDIQLVAEAAGSYILKAKPTSREVAGEASVIVQMVAVNAVRSLTLVALCGRSIVAGEKVSATLEAETEDAKPLSSTAASDGLAVKLTRNGEPQNQTDMQMAVSEVSTQSSYSFESLAIIKAGQYTLTAEYTERRPGLAPTRKSRQNVIRAVAVEVEVHAGQPTALSLQSPLPAPRLTVTNGGSLQDRLLLNAAALQLQDEFGNEAAVEGVSVRVEVRQPENNAAHASLPQLEMAELQNQETDCQGRAYFGNIYIREGSGKAGEDGMEFQLCFSAELDSGLLCEWACSVLFSDDAQKYLAMKELGEQHRQLIEKQQSLQGKLQCAQGRRSEAETECAAARRATEACRDKVTGRPASIAEAEQALRHIRERQERGEAAHSCIEARYGAPDQSLTKSLTRCLQASLGGMVGVFAQLATVDHQDLARVLAAQLRGMMVVLIVENTTCRSELDKLCTKHRLPLPDIMCLTHVLKFEKSSTGQVPGWQHANELAVELCGAACEGTDAALPVHLPHTRAITHSRREISGLVLGPNEWPEGCLGYAFNLVRPALRGFRASLLYPILGQLLVFDTLSNAQTYREYCTQVLKQGLADIVTLDLRRISGKGIISGASFKVHSLEDCQFRFGSTPANQAPQMTQARQQEAVLEQLIELLTAEQQAAENALRAQQEEEEAIRASSNELQSVEAEIARVDAQLNSQASGLPGSGSKRSRPQKHANKENQQPANNIQNASHHAEPKAKQKRRRLTRAQDT